MNKTKHPPLLASFIRSGVSFFAFFVLANISRLIFNANLFGMEEAPPSATGISCCIQFILLIFLFQSVYFTLALKSRAEKQSFLSRREAKGEGFSLFADLLGSVGFYCDLAVLVLLSCLLPLSLTYSPLAIWLFGNVASTALVKLYTLLITLPILTLTLVFAHISARKEFIRESNKADKGSELADMLKAMLPVVLVFIAASVVLPWFVPGLVTLWNLFGGMMLVWLPLIVIVAVALVIAYSYVRATLKLRRFIKDLSRLCSADGRKLSILQKPRVSLLKTGGGIDFSISTKKATYDCKIVSGAFRNSPIIFTDRGNGLRQITFRLLRADLFHFMSKIDYSFESENKKTVIVLPMPRSIFASVKDSPPRPADNGEKLGEYTLYSASGFINMLDRAV